MFNHPPSSSPMLPQSNSSSYPIISPSSSNVVPPVALQQHQTTTTTTTTSRPQHNKEDDSYFVRCCSEFDINVHIDWNETFQRAWHNYTNFRTEPKSDEISEIVTKFDAFAKRSVVALVHCVLGVPMSPEEQQESSLWSRVRNSAYFFRSGNLFMRIWANERAGHAQHQAYRAVMSIRQDGIFVPLSSMVKYRGVLVTFQSLVPLHPNTTPLCSQLNNGGVEDAVVRSQMRRLFESMNVLWKDDQPLPPGVDVRAGTDGRMYIVGAEGFLPVLEPEQKVGAVSAAKRMRYEALMLVDAALPHFSDRRHFTELSTAQFVKDVTLYLHAVKPHGDPDLRLQTQLRRQENVMDQLKKLGMKVSALGKLLQATPHEEAWNPDQRRVAGEVFAVEILARSAKNLFNALLTSMRLQARAKSCDDSTVAFTEALSALMRSLDDPAHSLAGSVERKFDLKFDRIPGSERFILETELLHLDTVRRTKQRLIIARVCKLCGAELIVKSDEELQQELIDQQKELELQQQRQRQRFQSLTGAQSSTGSVGGGGAGGVTSQQSDLKDPSSKMFGADIYDGVEKEERAKKTEIELRKHRQQNPFGSFHVKWLTLGSEKYPFLPCHYRTSTLPPPPAAAHNNNQNTTTKSSTTAPVDTTAGMKQQNGTKQHQGMVKDSKTTDNNAKPKIDPKTGKPIMIVVAPTAPSHHHHSPSAKAPKINPNDNPINNKLARRNSSGDSDSENNNNNTGGSGGDANNNYVTSPVRLYANGLLQNAFKSMRQGQASSAMRPLTAVATHWKDRFGPNSFDVAQAHIFLCVCHLRTKRVTAAMAAFKEAMLAFSAMEKETAKTKVPESLWLVRSQKYQYVLHVVAELRFISTTTGVTTLIDLMHAINHAKDLFFIHSSELLNWAMHSCRDLIETTIRSDPKNANNALPSLYPLAVVAEQVVSRAVDVCSIETGAVSAMLATARYVVDHSEWMYRSHTAIVLHENSISRAIAILHAVKGVVGSVDNSEPGAREPYLCRYNAALALALLSGSSKSKDPTSILEGAEATIDEAVRMAEQVCGIDTKEYEQCLRDEIVLFEKTGKRDEAGEIRVHLSTLQKSSYFSSRDAVRRLQIQMSQSFRGAAATLASQLEEYNNTSNNNNIISSSGGNNNNNNKRSTAYSSGGVNYAELAPAPKQYEDLQNEMRNDVFGNNSNEPESPKNGFFKFAHHHQSSSGGGFLLGSGSNPAYSGNNNTLRETSQLVQQYVDETLPVARTADGKLSVESKSTQLVRKASSRAFATYQKKEQRQRQQQTRDHQAERERMTKEQREREFLDLVAFTVQDEKQARLQLANGEHSHMLKLPYQFWPDLIHIEVRKNTNITLEFALRLRLSLTAIKPFILSRVSVEKVIDKQRNFITRMATRLQAAGRGYLCRQDCGHAKIRASHRRKQVAKRVEQTTKTTVSARVLELLAARTIARCMAGYRARMHLYIKMAAKSLMANMIGSSGSGGLLLASTYPTPKSNQPQQQQNQNSSRYDSPNYGRRGQQQQQNNNNNNNPNQRRDSSNLLMFSRNNNNNNNNNNSSSSFDIHQLLLSVVYDETEERAYIGEKADERYLQLLDQFYTQFEQCQMSALYSGGGGGGLASPKGNNISSRTNNNNNNNNGSGSAGPAQVVSSPRHGRRKNEQHHQQQQQSSRDHTGTVGGGGGGSHFSPSLLYPRPPPPKVGGWLKDVDKSPNQALRSFSKQHHQ